MHWLPAQEISPTQESFPAQSTSQSVAVAQLRVDLQARVAQVAAFDLAVDHPFPLFFIKLFLRHRCEWY